MLGTFQGLNVSKMTYLIKLISHYVEGERF